MKKLIVIYFLFLICTKIQAQIAEDKVLHFVGGGLYGLAGAGIAKKVSKGDRLWTFVGAVGASVLVGTAKEAIDASQANNVWDNADLLATVLGGVAVGITVDLARKRHPKTATAVLLNDVMVDNLSYQWYKGKVPPRALVTFSITQ